MNIEEIMKPYFDKKEEIENKSQINNKYLEEKRIIELRLERLRDNKDKEITEYIQNALEDRPDFYAGYGAMIRKDLEQEYLSKEQALESQIKELDEKMDANSKELSRYHRVDVRELIDVKHDLRKKLIAAKRELEVKLKETNLRFDAVMYKLSTFKYEYDENHNVLNGNQYRELFELSNSLIEQKYNLQRDLKQVEEYLKITELTEEEVKTVMMSMTDWEKEEYNRRNLSTALQPITIKLIDEFKEQYPELVDIYEERFNKIISFNPELAQKIAELSLSQTNFIERFEKLFAEYPNLRDVMAEFLIKYAEKKTANEKFETNELNPTTKEVNSAEIVGDSSQELNENVVEESVENPVVEVDHEQEIFESAQKAIEEQQELEENYSEFMKEVVADVLGSVKKLRTIKLENGKYLSAINPGNENEEYEIVENSTEEDIELVNGLYLNQKDLNKALDNYLKQNKGRSFAVKGIDLVLNVTRKSVNKVKKALRKASSIKLISEKKLSVFDIKRVYGKEKTAEYTNEVENYNQKTKMPTGNYVLLNDAYEALKDLFVEKTPTWLERLTSKFRKNEVEEIEEVQDAEYEQVEDEMTWNAEEPEYEVVRAKTK